MKISALNDIGDLGSKESEVIAYDWKVYYHVPSIILWVILLGVLIGLKENRNWQAWLIFVSIIVVLALYGMFKQLLHLVGSNSGDKFGFYFETIVIALAVLWLLMQKLGNGKLRYLWALGFLMIIGTIGAFRYGSLGESVNVFTIFAIEILATIFGLAIAAKNCRKKYSKTRFMLFLLLWNSVIVSIFLTFFVFITVLMMAGFDNIYNLLFLLMIPIYGMIMSAIFYALLVPYIVLSYKNSLYKERFFAFLQISVSKPQEVDVQNGENNVKLGGNV